MSQALRKLSSIVSKSQCVVIFINQLRDKIGVTYGSSETTTGGRALKFYASVRIDVRRTEHLKSGTEQYGSRIKCRVVKNKVAPPFKIAEFDLLYGLGISKSGEILDMAVALDLIKKSGSWFAYNGERLGQGRDNARKALEADKKLFEEIETKLRSMSDKINLSEDSTPDDDDEDDGGDELDIRVLKISE